MEASEIKFRELFHNANDAIFLHGLKDGLPSRFLEVNDVACRVLGYSRDEMLMMGPGDIDDPELAEHALDAVGLVQEQGHVTFEMVHITKDGRRMPVEISSHLFELGGELVVLSIARDHTERKRAEQMLAAAQAEAERRAAELQSFISGMADGASLTDAQGNVLWMNEAGLDILGVPPDEPFPDWLMRSKRFTMSGESLPDDEGVVERALRGETVKDFRYRLVTPEGRELIVSVSASPVRDPQGAIVGATYVFRDQSERVDLERRQQELLAREHRIAEVLQQTLISPQLTYGLHGCRIAVRYQSASEEAEVGGDFYDVIDLGRRRFAVLIGDVVGKGLPAAISVAAARHTIRSYAFLAPEPSSVLSLANEVLARDDPDESTVLTAILAAVDAEARTITYGCAGHEAPLVRKADGRVEEVDVSGCLLGVMCGLTYTGVTRDIEPGDTIILLTDGITEARAADGLFFDRRGVISYLERNPDADIQETASGVLEAAQSHAGGNLQDDAAVMVIESPC